MRDHQPINIATHLRHTALFSDLGESEISLIAKGVREVRCERGGTIFLRGDPCAGFHIVIFGQVKLLLTSDKGVEKIVEVVHQGESFGEAMLFLDAPYAISAQAMTNSLLLHIPKTAVLNEMARHHGLMRKMFANLARKTYRLMQDIEGYSLLNGKQRFIAYLLQYLEEEGRGGAVVSLELPVKKCVIASRLNLTQEHFSRILRELSELDLIRVAGNRFHIPDRERLIKHQFA